MKGGPAQELQRGAAELLRVACRARPLRHAGSHYLPAPWVLLLCAAAYTLGRLSPRPDLALLPRSPIGVGGDEAALELPRETAAAVADLGAAPGSSEGPEGRRPGFKDGRAPPDAHTLDVPGASGDGDAYGDAAPLPSAPQALGRKLAPAGTLQPQWGRGGGGGGAAADASAAPEPGAAPRDALQPLDEAGARLLRESGVLRLRPPLAPGDGGEASYRVVPFQVLSWYPRVVLLPAFLDAARCDTIIRLTEAKLRKSGLAYRPSEASDPNQETRTSWGTFVTRQEDPEGALAYLEDKIAAFSHLPVSHGEAFNVLRYLPGGHYDSHQDTFDPKDFGPQPSQRMATVVTYLTDVAEGGETVFKREGRANALRAVTDWRGCEGERFKVKPRKGDAVMFYSMTPDLRLDPAALHGACPVGPTSVKWAAVKWIHEKPFGPESANTGIHN